MDTRLRSPRLWLTSTGSTARLRRLAVGKLTQQNLVSTITHLCQLITMAGKASNLVEMGFTIKGYVYTHAL